MSLFIWSSWKANKGTLLIDQVSEIPLDIQSKILRVLTDQKLKINGVMMLVWTWINLFI